MSEVDKEWDGRLAKTTYYKTKLKNKLQKSYKNLIQLLYAITHIVFIIFKLGV